MTRRTASVKILHNKALNITKNPNYDGYQRGLYSMFCKIFDKKTAGGAAKNAIMQKKESAEELNKSIVRKFQKRKVNSSFIDYIWDANLANMKLLSKFNKGIRFLLCIIDIYSNMLGLFLWKIKKVL